MQSKKQHGSPLCLREQRPDGDEGIKRYPLDQEGRGPPDGEEKVGPVLLSPHLVVSLPTPISVLFLPHPLPLSLVSQSLSPFLSMGFHPIPLGGKHGYSGLLACDSVSPSEYSELPSY